MVPQVLMANWQALIFLYAKNIDNGVLLVLDTPVITTSAFSNQMDFYHRHILRQIQWLQPF